MSLQSWADAGFIAPHTSGRKEIGALLALADRDIADCQAPGLSADWRLAIAYNVALQAATAALAAAGYKAVRESKHYRVVQSLQFTIGADSQLVDTLDAFRKKRNISDYEMAGAVSDREADQMRELAVRLRGEVETWIKDNHPGLL